MCSDLPSRHQVREETSLRAERESGIERGTIGGPLFMTLPGSVVATAWQGSRVGLWLRKSTDPLQLCLKCASPTGFRPHLQVRWVLPCGTWVWGLLRGWSSGLACIVVAPCGCLSVSRVAVRNGSVAHTAGMVLRGFPHIVSF